jgi:hypothetical protein
LNLRYKDGPIWGTETIDYETAGRLWANLTSTNFSMTLGSYSTLLGILHTMNAVANYISNYLLKANVFTLGEETWSQSDSN